MSADFDNNIAFKASCELIFTGCVQPNGYTEPVLQARRLDKKAARV
jgi:malate synthase